MLDLGSTYFNFAISSVDPSQLEILSNSLFDKWEAYVDLSLSLPDYSLFLEIEEGSINGHSKIMSTTKALFLTVATYGGVMSGVDIIGKQLKATSNFLAEHAQSTFDCPESQATVRKKGGAPAALQRLFVRVQMGELSPEEASILARTILGGEEEIPGVFEALANAFHTCKRLPQQEQLPFDESTEDNPIELISKDKIPRSPKRRTPDIPPSLHYRVEVWRESKEKQKQTKVTVL